jgi:putative phosphoribosyl transferase
MDEGLIQIPIGKNSLTGNLLIPSNSVGIVLFAHGSGSSRRSPRNQQVAKDLRQGGLATLLIDLLTTEEEKVDDASRQLRFDIDLLAGRLVAITDWLLKAPKTKGMKIGYFGASTGAAAALVASAKEPQVAAVVSRGGRPDLAGSNLSRVHAPTLLIVGGEDREVIEMNQEAFELLGVEKQMEIVPGATHLFEEPGTLEEVSRLALNWFQKYLK